MLKYLLAFACLFTASCATNTTHGVILEDRNLAVVIPDVTRREDVNNLLGTPSFIIDDDWYYVTTVKQYRAFFTPQIVKHDLYKISFSGEVVNNIEHKTKHDVRKVHVPIYRIKTVKPNLKEIYNAD